MKKQPNILFYFTDQQRFDTCGCYGQKLGITPRLDALAANGTQFCQSFTAQPVCGPCRAALQTGKYPTQINCFRNDIALPLNVKTLANYIEDAGYETAYIGKWHLASGDTVDGTPVENNTITAIPPHRRGGYTGFWRGADVLEFTSHGYGGYVFDENMQKHSFDGYRVDCITDYALEFLDGYTNEKPFFITISHIEPHHQNDRQHYEGPEGSRQRFSNYSLPEDLAALGGGNANEEYPDYLGCCRSLDDNLGRIIDKLKEKDLYENTVIIFTSDHGSHFRTRNKDKLFNGHDDYKRSCHSACLQVPLVIAGKGWEGGKKIDEIVSTLSLPKTILAIAGVDVGNEMVGENLQDVANGNCTGRKNHAFAQISESRVGRCLRTNEYLYSICAPDLHGDKFAKGSVYVTDFLYDLESDPYELNNLADSPAYANVRQQLSQLLSSEMQQIGEQDFLINP